MIVRPPEPAFPGHEPRSPSSDLPDRRAASGSPDMLARGAQDASSTPSATSAALRDWVEHGARQPLRARARRGRRSARSPARPRSSAGGRRLRARPAPAPRRATRTPPCAGSARRTGSSPTTGRTSARPGSSSTRPAGPERAVRGRLAERRRARSAPRTTTRRSTSRCQHRSPPRWRPHGRDHGADRRHRPRDRARARAHARGGQDPGHGTARVRRRRERVEAHRVPSRRRARS